MKPKKESQTIKVMNHIVTEIGNENWPSGKRVRENELEKETGASRSTIRSAIGILIGQGVLSNQDRGTMVPKPDWDEFKDFLEYRMIIETASAGLACQRATKSQLLRLKKIVDEMEVSIKAGALADYINNDSDFHKSIAKLTKNERIISIHPVLRLQTIRFRIRSMLLPSVPETRYNEHKKILEMLLDKNVEGAEKAMRDHLTKTGELFQTLMK